MGGMEFNLATKPELVGKDYTRQGGRWPTASFTPTSLARWAFTEHRAFCHSTFDNALYTETYNDDFTKSARRNEFFVGSEVLVVDIDYDHLSDGQQEQVTLDALLAIPLVQEHAFIIMPSSGWRPDRLNWHLLFKMDEVLNDIEEYRALAKAFYQQFPFDPDPALAKVAQPTYGTFFKDDTQHAAGYGLDRIYINENAKEVSVVALRATEYAREQVEVARVKEDRRATLENLLAKGEAYVRTTGGSNRVTEHQAQTLEQQERVVIECLAVILGSFDQDTPNDLWYQVWTGAYNGSSSLAVRDFILDHPQVYWGDGNTGRELFADRWLTHEPRDDGYTVASLFYIARHYGWLRDTPYDVPDAQAEIIDVQSIQSWVASLDDIPSRVLLQSQTGSGKTQNLIYLFQRLGQPKTVVFVPTVKLAVELHATLVGAGLPATLYRDDVENRTKSAADLKDALLLVTTLQTFATKVYPTGNLAAYGLVFIEESDQILSQFARGGHGLGATHVREHEARKGFEALQDLFRYAEYVWGVDATLTKVSMKLFEAFTGGKFSFVRNQHVREKAPVEVVETYGEALQVILRGLLENKKVVVVTDTAASVEEVYHTMEAVGALEGKTALYLNRSVAQSVSVQKFMENVNDGARDHDFLVYNSVIGSGVSVTGCRPDVVVQLCQYLPPTANLQMLNRFRQQGEVYCWVRNTEQLYGLTATELALLTKKKFTFEAALVGVPLIDRDALASVREDLADTANAMDTWQMRAPLDYYKSLLVADGRVVSSKTDVRTMANLDATVKMIREMRKEMKDIIRREWRDAQIINDDNPPTPDMPLFDILLGEYHGKVSDALWGNVPEDLDPEYIATVVDMFAPKAFALTTFLRQVLAVKKAETYLADRGQALTAVTNSVTMAKVVSLVHGMYHRLDEELTQDDIEKRAPVFLRKLEENWELYDMVVSAKQSYARVISRGEGNDVKTALAFAKVLLAVVGLRQRANNAPRAYSITNLGEARDFLTWKLGGNVQRVDLDSLKVVGIETEGERRAGAAAIYTALEAPDQEIAIMRWLQDPQGGFESAVASVAESWNIFA